MGNNIVSWISKKQNFISLSLQRLNTSLSVVVARNFYGCKNFSLIMVFVKSILPSTVTIPVTSISLRI